MLYFKMKSCIKRRHKRKLMFLFLLYSSCLVAFSVSSFSLVPSTPQHTAGTRTMPSAATSSSVALKVSASVDPIGEEFIRDAVTEGRLVKLNNALVSFGSDDASHLLAELQNIRETTTDSTLMEDMLDDLLLEGPDRDLPLWARVIRPLCRYSQRARLASMRRTLNLTTPPKEESDEQEDTAENKLRRRRRALVALLRTLKDPQNDTTQQSSSKTPAIRQIERKARKEKSSKFSNAELLARRPADLETPSYVVVAPGPKKQQQPQYEIRNYEPYSVCTVSMTQAREANPLTDAKVNEPAKGNVKAFGALAGYLFGKNEESKAMKMTTPVMTTSDKRMSFVLPADYWSSTTATTPALSPPQPLQGSGVELENQPGGERAVMMFGGYATKVDQRKAELLKKIGRDEEWSVIEGETPVLYQYNDPFTPPWKRLNEVSIAVQRTV